MVRLVQALAWPHMLISDDRSSFDATTHSRNSKHLVIAEKLREQLRANYYGQQLPKMVELAEIWGVAPVTVKKAVDVLKGEGILRVVRGQGIFPTRLKRPRTHVLGGVLVADGAAPLHAQLIHGLNRAAAAHGEGILLGKASDGYPDAELSEVRRLCEKQGVDGVILWPATDALSQEQSPAVKYLKGEDIPFVLLPEPNIELYHDCSTVSNFDSGAVADLMTHLIALGHREILLAYTERQEVMLSLRQRRDLYERSLRVADYKIPAPLVLPDYPGRQYHAIQSELKARLESCTAVFCASDHAALALMQYCMALGIRVPGDLAIAGYGNLTMSSVIGLTSVEQHFGRIAEMAVDLLCDEIHGKSHGPVHASVPAELIVRSSTKGMA